MTENINLDKDWLWIKHHRGSYLQSLLLKKSGFQHCFFSKEWSKETPKSINKLFDQEYSIHINKQVHSNKVIKSLKANNLLRPEADGLISKKKLESLWIYTADCIPILFADPKTNIIAAIHAGWRGLSNGILIEAINMLKDNGVKPNDLIVAIGPSISGPNYEVDIEVAKAIHQGLIASRRYYDKKKELFISFGIIQKKSDPKKFMLDIKSIASRQLKYLGVNQKRISISSICTFSEKELFNSWRRDGLKKSQWAFICNS